MDYTEIIQAHSKDLYPMEEGNFTMNMVTTEKRNSFIDGVTSPLAKQITEIEVLNGKIEVLVIERTTQEQDSIDYRRLNRKISELEQTRDKLLMELNKK